MLIYSPVPQGGALDAREKRAVTRLCRIRGQAGTLATEAGSGGGDVLEQLAAMRSRINGLEADVLQGHLCARFGHADCSGDVDPEHQRIHATIDEASALVRPYFR